MICYLDRTFCPFHLLCGKGVKCPDALTESVRDGARKADLLISYYTSKPKCFTATGKKIKEKGE